MSQQPEVAFHFNAPSRLTYACRLLRKAYRKGARVLVLADEPLASELDQHLWTFSNTDFLPHALGDAPISLRARSPIVISHMETADQTGHPGASVLVNLRDAWPYGFEQFVRVIEVVSREPLVREQARQRWKRYKSQGIEPLHIDLQTADAV